jgi:hypothetical protein
VRRDLDPHGRLVRATETHQVVGDGAVTLQAVDEAVARLRVDELLGVERPDVVLGRLAAEAEHQFEVRVGRERAARVAGDRPDEHALVNRFEQTRERAS